MRLNFKRYYPILLLLFLVVMVFGIGMGSQRIIAYSTESRNTSAAAISSKGNTITNEVALFDKSIVHSIQIRMDTDEYDEMIFTYQNAGLKEYFHADITIDGVTINNVGIRLKGNASLRSALGGGMGPGGGLGGNNQRPGGQELNENRTAQQGVGQPPQRDGQNNQPGPQNGMRFPGNNNSNPQTQFPTPEAGNETEQGGMQAPDMNPQGMQAGQINPGQQANDPSNLGKNTQLQENAQTIPDQSAQTQTREVKVPFLIKFDEYEENQSYQNYEFLSIRNYGTNVDAAMLQEPVTNDTARLVGLPATQTAYSGLSVNGADETLYVLSEIIDTDYLEKFFSNPDGILYKAEVGSTLSYVNEDPSSYTKSFSQETRKKDMDLAPLINFLRFLDQADDATFTAELPNWLDVDSFATYLALNNLLVNTDSMIGMNNNYYLYYDDIDKRFTVLMWDANESLGKMGNNANLDVNISASNQNGGPGGGMRGNGNNVLMRRFLANADFKALYEEKVRMIYKTAFASGAMIEDVKQYSALIHSVNDERYLVEYTAYDQAVQKVIDFLQQRLEYLQGTEIIQANK
jgi:spore coat protein CotH